MTPTLNDKQLIWVSWSTVMTCIIVSAILAWHGQVTAMAAFMILAGQAIGILSPSALKPHTQGGSDTSVDASKAESVTVNQPAGDVGEVTKGTQGTEGT